MTMFDKLLKELENLNHREISIPINTDDDGYLDRECPNEECLFSFKVSEEDWKNLCDDEAVFCPMCGHKSPANSFLTTEQFEKAMEQARKYIKGRIDEALVEGARNFNRNQNRNSLVHMCIRVSGTHKEHFILPISAKKVFERKLKCEVCNANYAVIGFAYFCPCCGNNSVEQTLANR